VDSPPLAGTIQRCDFLVFASRSTSSAANTTHFPSGDGTGSLNRFSAIMSSKVNGCFAAAEFCGGACAKDAAAKRKLIGKSLSFMRVFRF